MVLEDSEWWGMVRQMKHVAFLSTEYQMNSFTIMANYIITCKNLGLKKCAQCMRT